MTTTTLHTAQLTLDLRGIYPRDIVYLRKGIANLAGLDHDVFHNHQKSGELQYRPSKIHYRSQDGKAVLFGFAEGADALLALARDRQGEPLQIGRRMEIFRVAHLEYKQQVLEIEKGNSKIQEKGNSKIQKFNNSTPNVQLETSNPKLEIENSNPSLSEIKYLKSEMLILDWLPLSEQNYAHWLALDRLEARAVFLERILYANIIAFCKSIAWQLPPDTLHVELLDCFDQQQTRFKDTTLLKFAIRFRTNITLPEGIALGRKGTFGFGVVKSTAKL
jgi:hypothetical protein